jgi:hypothetical protein
LLQVVAREVIKFGDERAKEEAAGTSSKFGFEMLGES